MRFGTRHLVQAAVAILLCAVVFPMVPAKAVVPGIIDLVPTKLRYNYTDAIGVDLTFNGGISQCLGFVFPSGSYDVSATLTLYRQVVSGWQYVSSWYGSETGGMPVIVNGAASVGSGTYKLVIRGNISNLEYPTASVTKTN